MTDAYKKWHDRMMNDPELHRKYREQVNARRKRKYRESILNKINHGNDTAS